MAEVDTFVNVPNSGFEDVDPAAEFLAREQNALAALDDDFDFAHTNSNDLPDSNHVAELEPQSTAPSEKVNTVPREEPEKIRKWREEQQRLLEQKDADEAKRKEELRQSAKHELEEWYARYAEQLEKSKINNRNAEKEWVAERDAEVSGQEWEKIARMCDFNPKSTRNTKDTSRMRSILLQLKQNPPLHKSA